MALEIEIDDRKLKFALQNAPKLLKVELTDGFDLIGRRFLKRFRADRLSGPPGVRGSSPRGMFGTFRRASLLAPTLEGMGLEIYSESERAKLHETGGRVTKPSGGNLAVPLSARSELFTTTGKLKRRYKRIKEVRGIKPVELKGKTFLARFKNGVMTPLFVLKRSVRIKPRLEFHKTWDKLQNDRIRVLNQKIDNAIRKM